MEKNLMDIDEYIEKYEKTILRYCQKLSGRKELAEEVTQETFLKVLANYALLSLQPEQQQLAWTYTTARNLVFDGLRAMKREENYINENSKGEPEMSFVEIQDLENILLKVNPDIRDILRMKYELGMNSREISDRLTLPEGTIRRRIQLGLKKN
ncbi:MAG: RNA polymerase sigma factor [Oligoflexia bacterium]|nr:RNA polymerase sigma factor [Oligoflexia bacterium]